MGLNSEQQHELNSTSVCETSLHRTSSYKLHQQRLNFSFSFFKARIQKHNKIQWTILEHWTVHTNSCSAPGVCIHTKNKTHLYIIIKRHNQCCDHHRCSSYCNNDDHNTGYEPDSSWMCSMQCCGYSHTLPEGGVWTTVYPGTGWQPIIYTHAHTHTQS